MKYRILGRTGLEVGELGIGCEGLVGKDLAQMNTILDRMEEAGMNCMDLCLPNPDLRDNLGMAMKGRREKFILQAHLCSVWKDGQYKRTREIKEVMESFEDMLTRLQTNYVDIGMIHYVDSMSDWEGIKEGPVMEYALALKKTGAVRSIGLSSHNPQVALAAVESGLVDVLMFSVNPCYDLQPADENCDLLWSDKTYEGTFLNMDPERQGLYEVCQRLDVGITVMKAFGGGDLLKDEGPAGKVLTPFQCLHYALTRPAVSCIMCGAHTMEELDHCIAYETAPDSEKDYAAALAALPKISWKGHCMYCGHCAPCPVGIDVASVTKFLNLSEAQGTVPDTVREHYAALPHTAGACLSCGACEKRCPFEVPVVENMKRAARLFGA